MYKRQEERIKSLEEAIQLNKSLGANWSLAENYNNLGTQYFFLKEYKRALEELNSAFVLAPNLSRCVYETGCKPPETG